MEPVSIEEALGFDRPIVGIELFKPNAKIPSYAYDTDSGADLFSCEAIKIFPGETRIVSTGVKMEFPDGWAGRILEKSGLALKQSVQIMGGVIDSSYRGEVNVIIHNASNTAILSFEVGDKVAQIEIYPVHQAKFEIVENVGDTERSANGFGSTGR
jgi:deoxyuridine 5''-triphosphate nucleotidohydrolase (dut)